MTRSRQNDRVSEGLDELFAALENTANGGCDGSRIRAAAETVRGAWHDARGTHAETIQLADTALNAYYASHKNRDPYGADPSGASDYVCPCKGCTTTRTLWERSGWRLNDGCWQRQAEHSDAR